MAKKWTEKRIENFVDRNGGEAFSLLDAFPFSEESLKKINDALEDDDNYTDSDVADLILELAYNQIK